MTSPRSTSIRCSRCTSFAIISEGIYARYLQGKTLGKDFEGMKRSAGPTAQRAIDIANSSSDRRLRGTAH